MQNRATMRPTFRATQQAVDCRRDAATTLLTSTFVDSATYHQVFQFLHSPPPYSYAWSWKCMQLVTCSYIAHGVFGSSPRLFESTGRDPLFEAFERKIVEHGLASNEPLRRDALVAAVRDADAWGVQHARALQREIQEIECDSCSGAPWLEWSSEYAWSQHVARLGGVFELELRHALLAIFERQITESELRSLHARTTTPEGLVNTIRSDNDRQMLQRLGLASSIVRGRAFAQAARSEGRGACLHPLRRIVLGGTADDAGGVSVDELLLANLVINSASLPLSTTDRTQRWVANITKIIRAGRSGVRLPYDDRSHLPPGQALADRDVVRRVCDFARALDLDIATKSHDAAVDACIGLGGELLQQALLPIGLPPGSVSIATSYWAEFTGIGPRIANRINRNNWHLTKLMQAPLQCVIKAPR